MNVLRVRVEGGELLQLGDLLNRYTTLAVVRDLHDVKFDITKNDLVLDVDLGGVFVIWLGLGVVVHVIIANLHLTSTLSA